MSTNTDAFLSLRDAVRLANDTAGAQEIWVPAWHFHLTRKSSTPGADDHDLAFGDLEITDSLTIHGAGINPVHVTQTVVQYQIQDHDAVFDLLGDYSTTPDGDVDYDDYYQWWTANSQDFYADGNDDKVIDEADYQIWLDNLWNTLDLINIEEF
jgi:hypothetical protein